MIELSLSGLVGAVLGTVLAAVAYRPLVALLLRGLQARDGCAAEDGGTWERERPLLLRAVFTADIALFAGLGYWIGASVTG
jgi:hypothetical protein